MEDYYEYASPQNSGDFLCMREQWIPGSLFLSPSPSHTPLREPGYEAIGGFTVDDGLSFRSFRFVSFRFVSFVFVPSATAFPGSQSTIAHLDDVYDKMGRKRLKKLQFLAVLYRRRRRRVCTSNRRFWVRQIFTKRREQGEFHNLIQEMRLVDPESHFRYLRMSK